MLGIENQPRRISRKAFIGLGGMSVAGLALSVNHRGPLHALGTRAAEGKAPSQATGYGPLVPKGDLRLPAEFNYQIISRQAVRQHDGTLTPGIFDAMCAFPDASGSRNPIDDFMGANHTATGFTSSPPGHTTILIRNHENRRHPGEIPVVVPPSLRYDEDPSYAGGCTKLVVRRTQTGCDEVTGLPIYEFEIIESFNILGGTDTNCAGGELPFKKWITCEEVVNRGATGDKHGYNFEIDAMSDGPVKAIPIPQAGRFTHEATAWVSGILYQTEDRGLVPDPVLGMIGSSFYRYIPDQCIGQSSNLAETNGPLEALAIEGLAHFNADAYTAVGIPLPVEWVLVEEPDHDDDTDDRRDRLPGVTPTRIQAQDKGAAYFDRQEGMWVSGGGEGAKVYFSCTEGGPANLGQVWEYDPGRETLTLIYVSLERTTLENPDNITIVPHTQDIFLCEDSPGPQFIRGVTQDGEIYDFAQAITNDSEFCGACFDPDGQVLYVNQQGHRLSETEPPKGTPETRAVTYAIYGPFEKRLGANKEDSDNELSGDSDKGSADDCDNGSSDDSDKGQEH
jgi:secreted PhoX family phosphatase